MAYFPQSEDLTEGFTGRQREQAAKWERLVPARDQVLKVLDVAREDKVIGGSLEAAVVLSAGGDLFELLNEFREQLATWFIVSQVQLDRQSEKGLSVRVERARGDKCERCWKFKEDVGSNAEFSTVCAECAAVLPEFIN